MPDCDESAGSPAVATPGNFIDLSFLLALRARYIRGSSSEQSESDRLTLYIFDLRFESGASEFGLDVSDDDVFTISGYWACR